MMSHTVNCVLGSVKGDTSLDRLQLLAQALHLERHFYLLLIV